MYYPLPTIHLSVSLTYQPMYPFTHSLTYTSMHLCRHLVIPSTSPVCKPNSGYLVGRSDRFVLPLQMSTREKNGHSTDSSCFVRCTSQIRIPRLDMPEAPQNSPGLKLNNCLPFTQLVSLLTFLALSSLIPQPDIPSHKMLGAPCDPEINLSGSFQSASSRTPQPPPHKTFPGNPSDTNHVHKAT